MRLLTKHPSIPRTILYFMLFPVFIWFVLFVSLVISHSYTIACLVFLAVCLIFLFIPVAIYFIHSNYFPVGTQAIMIPPPLITKEQKSARRDAFRFSAFYVVLFPIFLYLGLLAAMAGLSAMFLMLLIPLSMLVSIHLIWARYACGQYKKMSFFCILPILTFFVVDALSKILLISEP
jgi:hypothetical protein